MAPGKIAFLGSGETSLAGGRIFESLVRDLKEPVRIALLETPAGFELNSAQVVGRVGDFMKSRLQNYKPVVDIVPARRRNSPFSPDDPEILKPLLYANLIFMGPGSPTYAIRQLKGSLAWDMVRARHRLGASLVFASAATISVGAHALPVYEIYKVGQDVHIVDGLDLFADFGLHLSLVPHWNNAEGGVDLDTSRCFVGMERFAEWCSLLPEGNTTFGLDEHTGVILDLEQRTGEVSGVSSISLVRDCEPEPEMHSTGSTFSLTELGEMQLPEPIEKDIPPEVWELVCNTPPLEELPSDEVTMLAEKRLKAREERNWEVSDHLRAEIAALGWLVQDSKDGYKLVKIMEVTPGA